MPPLSALPPDETLSILDEVMRLPGAQAHHYAVVRRMLTDGLPLTAYSLAELQMLTGKSTTTCKGIRRWLTARITNGELRLLPRVRILTLGRILTHGWYLVLKKLYQQY